MHLPTPFCYTPHQIEECNGNDGESSHGEVASEGLAQVQVAPGRTAAKFTSEPNGESWNVELRMEN